jgi:hypothetical protein
MSIEIRRIQQQDSSIAEWSVEIPCITTNMLFDGPHGRFLDRFQRTVDILINSSYTYTISYTKHVDAQRVRMHIIHRSRATSETDAVRLAKSAYSAWTMATQQLVPAVPVVLNDTSWRNTPGTFQQLRVTRTIALPNTVDYAHPLHWQATALDSFFNVIDIFNHLEPRDFLQCRIIFGRYGLQSGANTLTRAKVENTAGYPSNSTIDKPFDSDAQSYSSYASLFDYIDLRQSALRAQAEIVFISTQEVSNHRSLQQLNQLMPPRRYFGHIPAFVEAPQTTPTPFEIFSHELARLILPPLLLHPKQRITNFLVRDAMIPVPMQHHRSGHITLGTMYDSNQETSQLFRLNIQDFNNHMLIAGTTGSGKTTTIKSLLHQLHKTNIPFIVFDPLNKRDYRTLKDHIPQLQIYTVGNQNEFPLQFNPFVVGVNMSVAGHISLMMGVFRSAFDLSHYVLDAIFEQSMFEVYAKLGFDKDAVIHANHTHTFPTLADYIVAIKDYFKKLSIELSGSRNNGLVEIKQAVERRITTIQQSLGNIISSDNPPITDLLRNPCILELGSIGDPSRVHFMLGMLLMRIFEEVMAQGRATELRYVLVLEESHRFMNDDDKHDHTIFEQLLAEVRGYGMGIIVADQMPGLLIPGVIGNTNLKILHRLDDHNSITKLTQHVLDDETRMLIATLTPGHTITIRDGIPTHVKVTPSGSR